MSDGLDQFLLRTERIAVIVAALAALVPIGIYIWETNDRRVQREVQKAQAIEFCTESKLIALVKPIIDELDKSRDPDNTTEEDRALIRSRIESTPLNDILKVCKEIGWPEPQLIAVLRNEG
jgi:hypothetical protein